MKTMNYLKILALTLLLFIAALFANSMDAAFWISEYWGNPQAAPRSPVTVYAAKFGSDSPTPISFGGIDNVENSHVHLKLRFRANSLTGYPNVFQTAPINRGMRLEISGSTAALVVADTSAPGGVKGIPVVNDLSVGQWYEIEVEALNHSFVRVELDGNQVANYNAATLSIEMSEILVGGGFDSSRNFLGEIQNISVTKGDLSQKLGVEPLATIHGGQYTYGLQADGAETKSVDKYDSVHMRPISFGEIKKTNNSFINLKLRFRAKSTKGYPNLFQTAPINRGLRLEISGGAAALLVSDLSAPGGVRGIPLTNVFEVGRWYALEVEALNHSFVRAKLDGKLVASYTGTGLSMETSELLVGGGFDQSRPFQGDIENISLTKGNFSPPMAFGRIKSPENAYVRLMFGFRADSFESLTDLFQTAASSRGMRMEISGPVATLVMPDSTTASGLKGITVSTALSAGQWYELEVEVLNGAFVRVLLDGHPVGLHVSRALNIEISEILVGGGVDNSRNFPGEIRNISVLRGNLPYLPSQRLMVVFAMLLVLIVILFVVFWKSLGPHVAVKGLMVKLFLLAFPLILILGYIEYRLSYVNTNYYTKRVQLERQLGQIEVLVTGSSNGFYGVAPEAFSHHGFNLAFPGNEMYSDARLIEKYVDKMPKLRKVIMTVNYYTMGSDDRDANAWRRFSLRQYFGISPQMSVVLPFNWGFWLEPLNFSKIVLYGNDTENQVRTNFLSPVGIAFTSSSGWFDSGVSGVSSPDFGREAASKHNTADINNFDRNLSNWETVIPLLQMKGIIPIIVITPTDVSYYQYLNKAKIELMNRKLGEFAVRHNVKFIDYTGDPRFNSTDFLWQMPDHINAQGAMKLGNILDDELIKPGW